MMRAAPAWDWNVEARRLLNSHDRLLRGLIAHRDAFAATNSADDPEVLSQLIDFNVDILEARYAQEIFKLCSGLRPDGEPVNGAPHEKGLAS